jgi:hypothetical protein
VSRGKYTNGLFWQIFLCGTSFFCTSLATNQAKSLFFQDEQDPDAQLTGGAAGPIMHTCALQHSVPGETK